MQDKETRYAKKVEERKNCTRCDVWYCEGKALRLHNPYHINRDYDSDHLDPWAAWRGDLNAEIMVVGQDWNDVDSFIDQKGKSDPNSDTNKALKQLFEHIGLDFDKIPLFLVNSILCMKEGGKGAKIADQWVDTCAEHFLKDTIDIVKPKAIITLGNKPARAIKHIYGIPQKLKVIEVIESGKPVILPGNIKWFPVFHCGKTARRKYRLRKQKEHWEKLIKPNL